MREYSVQVRQRPFFVIVGRVFLRFDIAVLIGLLKVGEPGGNAAEEDTGFLLPHLVFQETGEERFLPVFFFHY